MAVKKNFAEMDLFLPLKDYFVALGFEVKGEVKNSDLMAMKDELLVLVEMKKSFSLKLVYQAIDRQAMTDAVYIAIPRPVQGQNTKSWKSMLRLLKRLELGLLTVALDSPLKTVEIILEPKDSLAWKNKKKIQKITQEFRERTFDGTIGGVNRKKILTAYREKSLELLCILNAREAVAYGDLREWGVEEKQIKQLGLNAYGWFERKSPGVYEISEEGKNALLQEDFAEVITYYEKKWSYLKDSPCKDTHQLAT